MDKYIGISENKMKHILGAADECYKIAKQKGLNEEDCRKAYLIGYLYDVGYRFSEKAEEHPYIGNDMIKSLFGKSIYEIKMHGKIVESTLFLDILNRADLTIDREGNKVTMEERLKDIKSRYGESSIQVQRAKAIMESLIEESK